MTAADPIASPAPPPPALRPAFDLLTACLAVACCGADPAQLLSAHSPCLDWSSFPTLARRHGVIGPAVSALRRHVWDHVPERVRSELALAAQADAHTSLRLLAELRRILAAFAARAIPCIPVKGPLLALQVYGNLASRASRDLDLLVPPTHISAARACLESLGYTLHSAVPDLNQPSLARTFNELMFVNRAAGVQVDLEWDFVPPRFPLSPPVAAIWERAATARAAGLEFTSLAPEDLALMLCVHGTKHLWYRFAWILDLAVLVHRGFDGAAIHWPTVFARARECGCQRAVWLSLALADRLFPSAGIDAVLPSGCIDPRLRAAGQLCYSNLLQSGDRPSTTLVLRFMNLLLEGFPGRLRFSARAVLAPTDADWRLVSLPRPLQPAYVLIRLARLFLKWTRAGRAAAAALAWPVVLSVRIALWVLPSRFFSRRLRSWMQPSPGHRAALPRARNLAASVRNAASFVPCASCLTQAIALQILLSRARIPGTLRLGTAATDGRFQAHAWIEFAGQTILGGETAPTFSPLTPPSSRPAR